MEKKSVVSTEDNGKMCRYEGLWSVEGELIGPASNIWVPFPLLTLQKCSCPCISMGYYKSDGGKLVDLQPILTKRAYSLCLAWHSMID